VFLYLGLRNCIGLWIEWQQVVSVHLLSIASKSVIFNIF